MAMGTRRKRQRQQDRFYAAELVKAPGHPFDVEFNGMLDAAGLLCGKTIGEDATTLDAYAAMNTQEGLGE